MAAPHTGKASLILSMLLLLAAGPARAQPEESENDPRVAQAQAACLAGDVQTGARLLAELYVATNDVRWLFNQARCYQQNRLDDLAIARFEEFLREAPTGEVELRRRAAEYLEQLRPPRAVAPTPGAPPPPVAPPLSPWAGRLKVASLGVGALGLTGVVTGAVLSVRVNAIENQIRRDGEAATLQDPADVERKFAEGRRMARWQWPAYLIGGGLLAAGITGYLLSTGGSETNAHALVLVPVAGPGSGGAVARWTF
jgi:hypothetical protein